MIVGIICTVIGGLILGDNLINAILFRDGVAPLGLIIGTILLVIGITQIKKHKKS